MKKILFSIFCMQSFFVFSLTPWNDISLETKDLLEEELLNKNVNRSPVDSIQEYLNIKLIDCPYCQSEEPGLEIEKKLEKEGFRKTKGNSFSDQIAHCYGVSLYFLEHLLLHPEFQEQSCEILLNHVQTSSDFEAKVHNYSWNQHTAYSLGEEAFSIEFNKQAIELFFQTLLDKAPDRCYVHHTLKPEAAYFKKIDIYATLCKCSNSLLLIGCKTPFGGHCRVICTKENKALLFDPNLGLFQFDDLLSLTLWAEKLFKNHEFRWLVTFSLN